MVVALIQFALAVILDRMGLNKGKNTENIRNDRNNKNRVAAQPRITHSRPCKETGGNQNKKGNLMVMISSTDEFDFAAAWIYFFVVLLFNGAYWANYLNK